MMGLLWFTTSVALIVAQAHAIIFTFPPPPSTSATLLPSPPQFQSKYVRALGHYHVAKWLLEKFVDVQPALLPSVDLQELIAVAVVQETALALHESNFTLNVTEVYLDNVAVVPAKVYENPQLYGQKIKTFLDLLEKENEDTKEKVPKLCATNRNCDHLLDNHALNHPPLRTVLDNLLVLGLVSGQFVELVPSISFAATQFKVEKLLLDERLDFVRLARGVALKLDHLEDIASPRTTNFVVQ